MHTMILLGESYEQKNEIQNAMHIYRELAVVLKNTIGF